MVPLRYGATKISFLLNGDMLFGVMTWAVFLCSTDNIGQLRVVSSANSMRICYLDFEITDEWIPGRTASLRQFLLRAGLYFLTLNSCLTSGAN
jgi:hypothetical protein